MYRDWVVEKPYQLKHAAAMQSVADYQRLLCVEGRKGKPCFPWVLDRQYRSSVLRYP